MLPTVDTVGAARDHLVDAWSVVNASPAPVVPAPGLVLSAAGALAAGAFLADTQPPFRMRAAVTAVVSGRGAVRVHGGSRYRRRGGAARSALQRGGRSHHGRPLASQPEGLIRGSSPGRDGGTVAMARAGSAALVLAVVSGAVAGPWLPGASAEPWVDLAEFEVTDAAPWVDRPSPAARAVGRLRVAIDRCRIDVPLRRDIRTVRGFSSVRWSKSAAV